MVAFVYHSYTVRIVFVLLSLPYTKNGRSMYHQNTVKYALKP
jgi:hypothetical protein